MPAYPLSGELSRRRIGTESGALRREARAIERAGGNPQGFLEAAGKAKLQEGGAISSAEGNRAKQEFGVRAQAELARQQAGLASQMNGGGVLRSAANGPSLTPSGTNSTITPPPAPAQMAPSEPLTAMQSTPTPPTNQARADIEQFGLDEAIKRYYQRSAEADKAQADKIATAKIRGEVRSAAGLNTGTGVPEISAPVAIPEGPTPGEAALAESAATKSRVAARQAGPSASSSDVPDMMNQAVRQAGGATKTSTTSTPEVPPSAKTTGSPAEKYGSMKDSLDWVKPGLAPENVKSSLLNLGYSAANADAILKGRGITQDAFTKARTSAQSENQKAAAQMQQERDRAWRESIRTNPPNLSRGALRGTIAGDVWDSIVDPGGIKRAEMKRQEREKYQ